jgi:PTS system nitrogen regulatory IIA component
MENETLNLEQLAAILNRDARELNKLASRGHLPGQKVGGEWRFVSAEINYWLENQIHGYDEQQLTALETGAGKGVLHDSPLVTTLLTEQTMAVPLPATTRSSVLRGLVSVAEHSWQVYDAAVLLDAVKNREDMASTAQPSGVAFPHPHRPVPAILGESLVAYGRTSSGIPFGGDSGTLCDLFFLICCRDHGTHLRTLARLSRMLLRPGILDELRGADTARDSYRILVAAENELLDNG